MITCAFEDGHPAALRHVVLHAVVERNGALLLVRRAPHLLEGGKWGLPGGFMDRDETLTGGVLRELHEETGWKGRVVRMLRINSRPDRPHEDRQNVTFDFLIEPLEKTGEPDKESSEVQWIPLERIASLDLAFDHADSVQSYVDVRRGAVAAPVVL